MLCKGTQSKTSESVLTLKEMSFNFDRVKDIDDYTKSIVYGFVHSSQKLFDKEQSTYYTISDLITSLIILYYHQTEYFAKCPDDIQVNETKDMVQSTNTAERSIFGDIKINKHTYCNKFVWKFMVLNCSQGMLLFFGIDASEYKKTTGLLLSYGQYQNCFTEQNKENIVEMEFDTKNTTLRYYVNGRDQGISFDDVSFDNDEQYTMAISCNNPVTVKLLDFKRMHQ